MCAVGRGAQDGTDRRREGGSPSPPLPQPLLPLSRLPRPFLGPRRPPRVWGGGICWSSLSLGAWCSVDAQMSRLGG